MVPVCKRKIRSGSFQLPTTTTENTSDMNPDRPLRSIMTVQRKLSSDVHQGAKRTKSFNLAYSIYNPHLLQSNHRPLLMVHGGPGIPSDYLKPIAKHIQNRSVILYDQIGCGDSSEPSDIEAYSLDLALDDLKKLILHVGIQTSGFHLLGHSFGGILAYEYLLHSMTKEEQGSTDSNVLSLSLCSTPMEISSTTTDSEELLDSIQKERNLTEKEAQRLFHSSFICRSQNDMIPKALQVAYSKRGSVYTCDLVQDISLKKAPMNTFKSIPPIMLLRGEYDICSPEQCFGLRRILEERESTSIACKTLENCSHYPMLENPSLFIESLDGFLLDIDDTDSNVSLPLQ
jgi:proline iminopeptidase